VFHGNNSLNFQFFWITTQLTVYLLCLPSTEDFPEFSYTQHKHFYVAGKYEGGRAFVRPSGMEDVVCMHADASSQQSVDALAHAVCVQVYHLVGGISPEP